MSGTKAGGLKARDTMLAKNPNHYSEIGRLGGVVGGGKGFAGMSREKHHAASVKGGRISRRRPAVPKHQTLQSSGDTRTPAHRG